LKDVVAPGFPSCMCPASNTPRRKVLL
jgi:hypothetical protein